jgi:hypothetical protein
MPQSKSNLDKQSHFEFKASLKKMNGRLSVSGALLSLVLLLSKIKIFEPTSPQTS